MDKWSDKFAVVTGASSGIGAAITKSLAKNGVNVIGLARREEKIEEFAKELGKTSGRIFAYKCDISDLQSIKEAFKWIEEKFGMIHILINNAGIIRNIKILSEEDISDAINEVINVNFSALVHVTHEAFRLLKKSNDYGMIININSNAGHRVSFPKTPDVSNNVYHPSKVNSKLTKKIIYQTNFIFFYFQKSLQLQRHVKFYVKN